LHSSTGLGICGRDNGSGHLNLSESLRIDDLTLSDASALFNYRSHTDVARFQSWQPSSASDARAFIVRNVATPFNQKDSSFQFAVRSAATNEL